MRNGWRAAVAAATLVTLAGLAPASAAPASAASLVLTGTGASFADITLARGGSVLPMLLQENDPANGWSHSGCGRVRGFYLRPLSGDPMTGVGAVDFAELRYGSASDLPLPGEQIPRIPIPLGVRHLDLGDSRQEVPATTPIALRPGRYRAFLLGEGTCRVTVPLAGLRRTLRVSTTRRATMQAAVTPLDPGSAHGVPAAPGPQAGNASVPITVGPATFSLSLIHVVSYAHGVGPSTATSYSTCVTADPLPLCSPTAQWTGPVPRYGEYHGFSSARPQFVVVPETTAVMVPTSIWAANVGHWHAPGWLTPGRYYAKVNGASFPATAMQAVAFALDL